MTAILKYGNRRFALEVLDTVNGGATLTELPAPPLTAAEIRGEIARLQAALTDERNFFVHPGDDADPEGDVRRQIADLLDDLSDLEQTRIEEVE